MRVLIVLAALAAAMPAAAQQFQAPTAAPVVGARLGQLEVKAYQTIPKTKVAVQLTSDTSLSRELRRQVMVRVARRGNEVGFSGGNVMRMDVTYIDLSPGGSPGVEAERSTIPGGTRSYDVQGSNPRPELPAIKLERRDSSGAFMGGGPTLRITLTLYAVETGKVIWAANASCVIQGGQAETAGLAMIDNIFDDADKSHIADAGCPL